MQLSLQNPFVVFPKASLLGLKCWHFNVQINILFTITMLHYILISHDETISQYFFIPLSKRLNSKSNLDSKYAYCNLIARLLGKINDGVSLGVFELSLQESYRLYLDLIEQIVEVLNDETDNCFHLVGMISKRLKWHYLWNSMNMKKRLKPGDWRTIKKPNFMNNRSLPPVIKVKDLLFCWANFVKMTPYAFRGFLFR